MSFWLISVPKAKAGGLAELQSATAGAAQCSAFDLPSLKVGTLDQLMALSEDTQKMDTFVGGVAKKIEKTYYEMWKNEAAEVQAAKERTAAAAGQKDSSSSSSGKEEKAPELKIGDQNKNGHDFVTSWQWNDIRYPRRSPLRLLSEQIMKDSSKSDEALKKQVAEYNEVRTAFTAIERRDQGTLLVRPVSQYLQKQPLETPNFTTLLLVVPRARKEEFETTYETLEADAVKRDADEAKKKAVENAERARKDAERKAESSAASAASPTSASSSAPKTEAQLAHEKERAAEKVLEAAKDAEAKKLEAEMENPAVKAAKEAAQKAAEEEEKRRNKKLDFPAVVFRSHTCLCNQPGEEFLLYSVIVLRQGVENYKNLCREKRYVVRPFKFDPEEDRLERERKQQLAVKKKSLWNYLIRWCTTTYTEVFTAWVHLKAIRLYVESVLRYGLPFDSQAALIEPNRGKERQLRETLRVLYSRLAGNNANLTTALDPNEPDISGLGADFYSYVYLPLTLGE